MSDAPERIWAFYAPHIAEDENGATIVAHETVQHGAAEYVRADRIEALTKERDEALLWCSGSADFNEGGVAREGWLKVCAPLLNGESHD